jgi:hypothetical protein
MEDKKDLWDWGCCHNRGLGVENITSALRVVGTPYFQIRIPSMKHEAYSNHHAPPPDLFLWEGGLMIMKSCTLTFCLMLVLKYTHKLTHTHTHHNAHPSWNPLNTF